MQMKNEKDPASINQLKQQKRAYLPENYPRMLKIGDIVHVNFGFGYCSELSDGHYGIILSEIKANMYFVLPLGSEPLKIHPFYFDDLNLPSRDGVHIQKKSYLQFNQMGNVHYRRLENVRVNERRNIGDARVRLVFQEIAKFLEIGLDKNGDVSYNSCSK